MKDYLKTISMFGFNFTKFVDSAIDSKKRYVFLHFIFICMIVYFPIFLVFIKVSPNKLYSQIHKVDFSNPNNISLNDLNITSVSKESFFSSINIPFQNKKDLKINSNCKIIFSKNFREQDFLNLDKNYKWFCISEQEFYFVDNETLLKSEINNFYSFDTFDFNYLFDEISFLTGYSSIFLLGISGILFFVVISLQLAFYISISFIFSLSRNTQSKIDFHSFFKLLIFSSTVPAILTFFVGLFAPIIHLVIFQIATSFFLLLILKRYDKLYLFRDVF